MRGFTNAEELNEAQVKGIRCKIWRYLPVLWLSVNRR